MPEDAWQLHGELELAKDMARAAGSLLKARYRLPPSGLESKSTRTDMVSDADRDAEALIREELAHWRPDDGLLGEEGSQSEGSSGRRWVIDPLDGTTNYLYRFPSWAVSIALADAEGALVGVVHDPLGSETFSAIRGGGAELNGHPISPSGVQALDEALIGTGFGYEADRRRIQAAALTEVIPAVRDIRRAGSAALDLCMVACGRLDGYYERGLQEWDWAAARLIAGEAGATVVEMDGEPHGLIAAGPALIEDLTALVRSTGV